MAQVSEKKLAELVAGSRPASTFAPRAGFAWIAKAEKPAVEKQPMPLPAWREPAEPKMAAPKPVKRPKDTGPSKGVREWVWERLGRVCVVPDCGREATELHHRMNRGMGGDRRWFINHPANLVPACHDCNGEVERKRTKYEALGMFLEEGSWPYLHPVNLPGSGWMVWDRDAEDWVSVHDVNDWLAIDRAGVTV